MNATYKAGRIYFDWDAAEDAAWERAWNDDPTKSKYRYRKALKAAQVEALERAGYRYGKSHWCGGSGVLYNIEMWNRWDAAPNNQLGGEACTVTQTVTQRDVERALTPSDLVVPTGFEPVSPP